MNRGEIRTKVLNRLNQDTDSPQYWETDHINRVINEGYINLMSHTHTMETSTTLSLIAYQHVYELAAAAFILLRMFYETTDRLIMPISWAKLNNHDPQWVDSTDSRPRQYIFIPPNKVFLYPAVTADSDDAITYYYTQIPSDMTADSDTPDIPEIYHDALVEFALSVALVRGGEAGSLKRAEMYYMRYKEKVASLLHHTVKRSPRTRRVRPRFG